MIGRDITSLFQKALEKEVTTGKVLVVKGSRFPLTVDGAVELKGKEEAFAETKAGHDAAHPPVFGYVLRSAEELFGNNIIANYASKEYMFWSKSNPTDKQANNRIQFQQSIGARYVWGTNIQDGGVLPAATGAEEVLNTLTPHVVLTTSNLRVGTTRTRVDAFFAQANTAARGDIPVAHEGETEEQIRTRLDAESKANAVAVIDVEPITVRGVHELHLGCVGNNERYPAILPEIRRLIVTTTSDGPLTIGNGFLSGCEGLTSLELRGFDNITTIRDKFLFYLPNLGSLDLTALKNITKIGDQFLHHCPQLTSINLNFLNKITKIGNNFLDDCHSLIFVDLSPLRNVTIIGNNFLSYCTALPSIDLSPLENLTTIGDSFLGHCNLTSVDLSPLTKVVTIGNAFLIDYTNLRSLNLAGLKNVTTIGSTFLFGLSELTSLDLSPLKKLKTITDDFLWSSHNLRPLLETIKSRGKKTPSENLIDYINDPSTQFPFVVASSSVSAGAAAGGSHV